jgi:RNA polymerase sigma-70 factor, ECF subfamily
MDFLGMPLAIDQGMLRITQLETGQETRLRIEGRLTGNTLGELTRFAEAYLTSAVLDLAGLTFVDKRSAQLLNQLRRGGATLEGCSGFLTELLGRPGVDENPGEAVGSTGTRPDAASEDDLIEDVRRGDEQAFAALVRREGGRMLATARRLLGNEPDAQNAVQEAFLQAHRAIGSFAGKARLSTWLHRIVVNAALMKLRRRRRKPEQPIDDLMRQFDETGSWLRPVSGWERSSDELLESAECRASVRGAIGRLPESYRQVLMLRDIEDFDTDETADMVGASANAVKVRLHRARQALRTLLEHEFTEN